MQPNCQTYGPLLEFIVVGNCIHPSHPIAALLLSLMVMPWTVIVRGSLPERPRTSLESLRLTALALPITVDLDGDCRADNVSLLSNGFDKTIQIKFANSRNSNLNFTAKSADRGIVFAYDINHDSYPDLVWVASSGQETAVVLINDGSGNFTESKDNAPFASEISALLRGADPSDQSSVQGGCQALILTSSPSSPTASGATRQAPSTTSYSVLLSGFDPGIRRSRFVPFLRKRGPPLFVS